MSENFEADDVAKQIDAAQANIVLGEQLRRDGDFDAAVERFTEVITAPLPNGPERNLLLYHAHACRGAALAGKGDVDTALDDLSIAIQIDPERAIAWYNRGMAWEQKGEQDQAIADYNRAFRLDPNLQKPSGSVDEMDTDGDSPDL